MSIVSELSRYIKALGGKKKAYTIASNLHQLANMAENGEISGGSSGYTVTEETTRTVIVPEQTVTTAEDGGAFIAALSNVGEDRPDELTVNYNGTTYTCAKGTYMGYPIYGASFDDSQSAWDFSEFPFAVFFGNETGIYTESAATVTVSAYTETTEKTVEVTDDFKAAVEEAGGGGAGIAVINFTTDDGLSGTADKTFNEIVALIDNKQLVVGCFSAYGAVTQLLITSHTPSKTAQKKIYGISAFTSGGDYPSAMSIQFSDADGYNFSFT